MKKMSKKEYKKSIKENGTDLDMPAQAIYRLSSLMEMGEKYWNKDKKKDNFLIRFFKWIWDGGL